MRASNLSLTEPAKFPGKQPWKKLLKCWQTTFNFDWLWESGRCMQNRTRAPLKSSTPHTAHPDEKGTLRHIKEAKSEQLMKWAYKAEEMELGKTSNWRCNHSISGLYLCGMDSQMSLHLLLKWHYLQNPHYLIFSMFSIFSGKKSAYFISPLKLLSFLKLQLIEKKIHRNPSLQKKFMVWAHTLLCSCSSKDLLLLSRWWKYSPIPNSDKIHLFILTLHIYTKIIYSLRFNIFMYYIHV